MVDQEMSALFATPLQSLQQKARTEAQLPWEKSKIETTTPQAIGPSPTRKSRKQISTKATASQGVAHAGKQPSCCRLERTTTTGPTNQGGDGAPSTPWKPRDSHVYQPSAE